MGTGTMGRLIKIACFTVLSVYLLSCGNNPAREYVLFDFETPSELDQIYWNCRTMYSLADKYVTHGSKSLQLDLYPADYPGFSPILKKKDWSAYMALYLDIYNPQKDEIPITLRIDDRKYPEYKDRYNKSFVLQPGMNHLLIPFNSLITSGTVRKLDLKSINNFQFFMVDPNKKIVLYIDYIRLVS